MPITSDPALEPLHRATLRVIGKSPGTGLVLPQCHIASCAHVVGRGTPPGTELRVQPWGRQPVEVRLIAIDDNADLALLGPPVDAPCPVELQQLMPLPLDGQIQRGDRFAAIGFPKNTNTQTIQCEEIQAEYEFYTHRQNQPSLLKLKLGQFRPGFSGGGLLNLRTGRICGLVKETRDEYQNLGGRAIPIEDLIAFCRHAGLPLSHAEPPPAVASEQAQALAAFLQQLPKWQDLASRRLFVQWALLNHPHAGDYQPMGQNPAADAQALALATLGPGATDAGLDAARQLLQQVLAEPVGKATKAEAKRLLKLLDA